MELVAYLGNDKENWGQVKALCSRMKWDSIILVKNKSSDEFGIEKADVVKIDSEKPLLDLKAELINKLKTRLNDIEVALSLASGNGKEHMAIISALLSIPVGIRLVVYTKEGVQFIN
jgi:hypothetical protein